MLRHEPHIHHGSFASGQAVDEHAHEHRVGTYGDSVP